MTVNMLWRFFFENKLVYYYYLMRKSILICFAIIILRAGYAGEGEVRQLHQGCCHSNRSLVFTYIPSYKYGIKNEGLCLRYWWKYPWNPAKLATATNISISQLEATLCNTVEFFFRLFFKWNYRIRKAKDINWNWHNCRHSLSALLCVRFNK